MRGCWVSFDENKLVVDFGQIWVDRSEHVWEYKNPKKHSDHCHDKIAE